MKTRKIKLLRGVAGGVYTYAAGQVVDAPLDRAEDLVNAQHAEYVDDGDNQKEKATSPAAGKAEKR
jgi:hypothetical protein